MGTLDKVFLGCLIGGFAFAALMGVSAGAASRFRLPYVRGFPRLHVRLPRLRLPRIRLPRLQAPKVAVAAAAERVVAGGQASAQVVQTAAVPLLPPGTAPFIIGLCMAFFGLSGLFFHRYIGLPAVLSVVPAGGVGVVASLGIALFFSRYLLAGEAASEVRGGSLLGKLGHVSVAIPEGGVGAVAFQAEGKRVTLPAGARDGLALGQGVRVMIVDTEGQRLIVEEYESEL